MDERFRFMLTAMDPNVFSYGVFCIEIGRFSIGIHLREDGDPNKESGNSFTYVGPGRLEIQYEGPRTGGVSAVVDKRSEGHVIFERAMKAQRECFGTMRMVEATWENIQKAVAWCLNNPDFDGVA